MKTIKVTELATELAKDLVEIPSYVSNGVNEKEAALWLCKFLEKYTDLQVTRQRVVNDRFNIIATKGTPRLWLCGHIDTVEPKNPSQLRSSITNSVVTGLGSVDMKGGIAAILSAVAQATTLSGVGLLFYCDEEYFFAGMKKFTENFDYPPALAVFAEPTNLAISNAHRGLIEFSARIKGATGHASRPWEGINAIENSVFAISELADILKQKYSDETLGITTCTLSKMQGGTMIGTKNNGVVYSVATNSIPDVCEVEIDIRPASTTLKAKDVLRILEGLLAKRKCVLVKSSIKADYAGLLTPRTKLGLVEKAVNPLVGVSYLPSSQMGYGDGQMLFEKTGCDVIYFGPGPTELCHKEDEYVNAEDLLIVEKVFINLIEGISKEGGL